MHRKVTLIVSGSRNVWAAGSLKQGRIQGGRLGAIPPLQPAKVILFTMNLHNSENSIRDLTDILSSFVWSQQSCEVYFISFAVAKPLWSLTFKYYWDRPPPSLTLHAGSAPGLKSHKPYT